MESFKLYFIVIFFFFVACSPKLQDQEIIEKEEIVEVVEQEPEISNPCRQLSDLDGALKEQTEIAYVLYRDQIKLNNFDEAFKLWNKAYYNAPAANGKIKYQFEDGVKIYKHLYKNTQDENLKESYVDSVMSIYNKRIECFGEPYYVAGRKAFDFYYSFPGTVSIDSIYALFKMSIDGKQMDVDYFVINPFTKILNDKILENEIILEEASYYALLLLKVIEKGNASGKNIEAWSIINSYATPRLENLEGINGFYNCEYYLDKYYQNYLQDTLNCEVINTAYSRMLWGGCSKDNEIVFRLADAKARNCYTPPPPPGTLRQAFDAYTEGNYTNAIELFNQFVNETEDEDKKFKYNLLIAKIYYGDIKNYEQSRKYALRASEFNPKSGEPYLLIGKLYASSGPLCGPGRGWDSQIVTWPAIDMFEIATNDPLVADEAKQFIRTYWQYMPNKEDIHQRTIKVGSEYKVKCWINRTTRVRTSD